jgi:hypothetical protein
VADEWVTQLLRQGDAKVFKKYSQMKLQMKREALHRMNRWPTRAGFCDRLVNERGFATFYQLGIRKPLEGAVNLTILNVGA